MALRLVRKSRTSSDSIVVAIATNSDFHSIWLPLIVCLNLPTLPILAAGGWLDEEARVRVIQELEELRSHLEADRENEAAWIVTRIEDLLATLRGYSCTDYEFTVG